METAVDVEVPSVETTGEALRVADRCDSDCNAQAFVRTAIRGGQLLFCAHHYAKHELALLAQGAVLLEDNRAQLTARPANVNAV